MSMLEFILNEAGYDLLGQLQAGIVGKRFSVVSREQNRKMVADVVSLAGSESESESGSEYLASLCHNASAFLRKTTSVNIANVVHAKIVEGGVYAQITELDPKAVRLDLLSPISEELFWQLAKQLISGLRHAHKRELVHACLCPESVYVLKDVVKLTNWLWCHNAAGRALSARLQAFLPDCLAAQCLPFAAPEVLKGGANDRNTDMYALAGVLYFSLCGKTPRAPMVGTFNEAARLRLAKRKIRPLEKERPDLVGGTAVALIHSMLNEDQDRRPNAMVVESIIDEMLTRQPKAMV